MSMRLVKHTGRSPRFSNSEDLFREKKALDNAAKAAGVPSLFSFTHSLGEEDEWTYAALGNPDTDDMAEEEEEKFEKKLEKTAPRVGKWYAAADGIKTVDALLTHLRSTGSEPDSLQHTLKELRKRSPKPPRRSSGFVWSASDDSSGRSAGPSRKSFCAIVVKSAQKELRQSPV